MTLYDVGNKINTSLEALQYRPDIFINTNNLDDGFLILTGVEQFTDEGYCLPTKNRWNFNTINLYDKTGFSLWAIIMIGFFLSLLLFILIPQILLTEIYGDTAYIVLIWLLLNFMPHALLLFYKRESLIVEHKNLLNGVLVGYYLLIILPILLRTYFFAAIGILPVQQLIKSLWALIPLQLIYIFIILQNQMRY